MTERIELTPAEKLVAQLLVNGQPNKQMAYNLGKAEGTVRQQLATLMTKAGVHSRLELVVWLVANDLVDVPERFRK